MAIGLDGRFLRVNRALGQLVGYLPEELIPGGPLQTITHPERHELRFGAGPLQLARREIPNYQIGKRYVRKDGTIVNVSC